MGSSDQEHQSDQNEFDSSFIDDVQIDCLVKYDQRIGGKLIRPQARKQSISSQEEGDSILKSGSQKEYSSIYDQQSFQKQIQVERLDPNDFQQLYCDDRDQAIIKLDIPERIHLNHPKRLKVDTPELLEEAEWIQRILNSRQIKITKDQITKILTFYLDKHFEIMYIYQYKLFQVELSNITLDVLWEIQDLDEQWKTFKPLKEIVQKQMIKLDLQEKIKDPIDLVTNIRILQHYKQYFDYCIFEMRQDLIQIKDKQPDQRALLFRQINSIDLKDLNDLFISPSALCQNFQEKKQKNRPKTLELQPSKYFQKFVRPDSLFLRHKQTVFSSLIKYFQSKLFSFPKLKFILFEKYKSKLQVSTVPTVKGESLLIDSYLYPVKRIHKRSVSKIDKELWVLVEKAQKLGMIKVQFCFEWEEQKDRKFREEAARSIVRQDSIQEIDNKDQIYIKLRDYYLDHQRKKGDNFNDWNFIRKQVLLCLLYANVFPELINKTRKELHQSSEKYVIKQAANKFKELLRKGPILNRQNKPAKVLTLVIGQHYEVGCAVIDHHSQVLQKMLIPSSTNFPKNFSLDSKFMQVVNSHRPHYIIVEANSIKARILLGQLRNIVSSGDEIHISYGQSGISGLVARHRMMQGSSDHLLILQAISLGRFKQNPLHQLLSVWHQKVEKNGCLHYDLHYLQKDVNQTKLKNELQRMAVQIVNQIGVDLNLCLSNNHFNSVLQFVCGLGPRKVFNLLNNLKVQRIQRRSQLKKLKLMEACVYQNCHAFFKIDTPQHQRLRRLQQPNKQHMVSLLQCTRISQSDNGFAYEVAKQLANPNPLQIIYEHEKAVAICGQKKFKKYDLLVESKKKLLSFIKMELQNPFSDLDIREKYKQIEKKQVLHMLINESPHTFKNYQVYSVKVVKIINVKEEKGLMVVRINQNGIYGNIYQKDLPDGKQLSKFQKGDILRAMIIPNKKESQNSDKHNLNLTVQMTLQPIDRIMQQYKEILKQSHPSFTDLYWDTFKVDQKNDFPQIKIREEVVSKLAVKKFNHPKFIHMGLKDALQYLKDKPNGDYVIRPSSKGREFINITWKFYGKAIVHLSIMEETRNSFNQKKLKIESIKEEKWYHSYDDLIHQYIIPVNKQLTQITKHKKFVPQTQEEISSLLIDLRRNEPTIIHYRFGCFDNTPQYVVLLYTPRDNKINKQYIKVKDTGLLFHDNIYPGINQVIQYFKNNYSSDEYRQKYRRARAPFQEKRK